MNSYDNPTNGINFMSTSNNNCALSDSRTSGDSGNNFVSGSIPLANSQWSSGTNILVLGWVNDYNETPKNPPISIGYIKITATFS